MINLDHTLIHACRSFINGANVHRVKEMLFAYEQAVELHNQHWPGHQTYQPEYEKALRLFLFTERLAQLRTETIEVTKRYDYLTATSRMVRRAGRTVCARAEKLRRRSEEINRIIDELPVRRSRSGLMLQAL